MCKNFLCKWKMDSHWMKYVTLQFERKNFIGCLGAVIIKVWKNIGCWTCLKQTFRDIGLLSEHFGAAFLSECLPWISLCLCNFVHSWILAQMSRSDMLYPFLSSFLFHVWAIFSKKLKVYFLCWVFEWMPIFVVGPFLASTNFQLMLQSSS